MAGIYIHIPFCGHACTYCDFYFTTHLNFKEDFLKALNREIESRKEELNEPIETIYFGGGTPSQLNGAEIGSILDVLNKHYSVIDQAEITLEANPDDISTKRLLEYKAIGINRFSMGTQSFHDEELKLLGRMHSSTKALESVQLIREAGFDNFNLDLIYGIPGSTVESWSKNLVELFKLSPNHVSAYCLTIEPGTQLAHQVKKDRIQYPSDNTILKQFDLLLDQMEEHGYEHYEISNFSKPNQHSKHNTAYWFGKSYLGFGPSAHSHSTGKRRFNVASTPQYVKLISEGESFSKDEELSANDQFNEFVMTRLRTKWGIPELVVQQQFGERFWKQLLEDLQPYLKNNEVVYDNRSLVLTRSGKYLADKIASDCFRVD